MVERAGGGVAELGLAGLCGRFGFRALGDAVFMAGVGEQREARSEYATGKNNAPITQKIQQQRCSPGWFLLE